MNTSEDLAAPESIDMDSDSSNLKRKSLDPSDGPVTSSQMVKKEAVSEEDRQLKIVKSNGSTATKPGDSKSIKTSTFNKIKTKR